MAARRLSAADLFDTLDVDLWGNHYTLREITRSVIVKLNDAQKQLEGLDEEKADTDEFAHAMIQIVDVLLKPVDDGPPATDVLTPLWDDDKMGVDWLTAFVETLQEEAGARRRPTSPQTNSR